MINVVQTIFILIYILTVLLAATEMVPLSLAALIGALLAIWFGINYGVFTYEDAIKFIDIKLIGLLVGVMIVIEVTERSGLFHVAALYAIKIARGDPVKLFFSICFVSAAASLFLSDVTAILLIAAAAGTIARIIKVDPSPYFISAAIMVNLGGTSTLIGSVSNMIIGMASGLSFTDFISYLTLGEVALWILVSVTLYFYYKPRLGEKRTPPTYNPWESVKDRKAVYKAFIIMILFFTLLFIYDRWNIGPEAVALGVAILALAATGVDPAEVFKRLDWETIFFIGGFFFIVGGVEKTGLLALLSQEIFKIAGGSQFNVVMLTLWSSGLVSAVVSNIAVALTFTPIIQGIKGLNSPAVWSALIFGTNLGGAATPFSGTVCIMTLGALKHEGINLNLADFTKVGVLTTFVELAFSALYLIVRFSLWS